MWVLGGHGLNPNGVECGLAIIGYMNMSLSTSQILLKDCVIVALYQIHIIAKKNEPET
jgi:hypothetical protein